MTPTDFKTHLHSLIQLQRTAYAKEGVPDVATRSVLGLPDSAAALRLCSALEQSLWAT